MTTKLRTIESNPLRGGAADFADEDGDAVVTFMTINSALKDAYENSLREADQAIFQPFKSLDKTDLDLEEFLDSLRTPGVYEDYPEEENSECYTIIVPSDFFTVKFFEHWISVLNNKFGKDYVLYNRCATCEKMIRLTERFKPRFVAEHESWKRNKVFCGETCFRQHVGRTPSLKGKGREEEERKEKKRKEKGLKTLDEVKEELEEVRIEETDLVDKSALTRQAEQHEQGCQVKSNGEKCGTIALENVCENSEEKDFWLCERHFTQYMNNALAGEPLKKWDEDE